MSNDSFKIYDTDEQPVFKSVPSDSIIPAFRVWDADLPMYNTNPKRGAVLSSLDPLSRVKLLAMNPGVYYNWSSYRTPSVLVPQYIPIIWGASSMDNIATMDASEVVLGFNEPDKSNQANMTVSECLTLWPQIEASPKFSKLGSPSFAQRPNTSGGYLEDFMDGDGFGYVPRVDFITMHRYVPPGYNGSVDERVERFMTIINETYDLYGLPIWVTEIGIDSTVGSYDVDDTIDFMTKITAEFDSSDYVEKYFWKSEAVSDPAGLGDLWTEDGKLTELGRLYSV